MSGKIYVIATPIGNLQDITARAVQTLQFVDLIAAEDTRHTKKLLQHLAINKPLTAYHEHNEVLISEKLIKAVMEGKNIALVSDAGTPLISDPGFTLIASARLKQIEVIPVPGACAAIAALCVSGLPNERFSFEGFLPTKSQHRLQFLSNLKTETRTMIFYEAPHRILDSVEALVTIFGAERKAVIARELTKIYETVKDGSLSELLQWLKSDPQQQKGEFVILVHGQVKEKEVSIPEEVNISTEKLLEILLSTHSLSETAEIAAKITGLRRNALYAWLVGRV